MTASGGLFNAGHEAGGVALDRLDGLTADDASADDPDDEFPPEPPIEPGSPTLENALFVLLGVLIALAVIARLVQLFA